MNLEELLKSLSEDIELCKELLSQISQEVIRQEVSRYPIFIAYTETIELGKPVFVKEQYDMNWSFNVSHLEEFVNRDIINDAMTDQFKEVYKDPQTHLCVFVIYNGEGNFVFKPLAKKGLS